MESNAERHVESGRVPNELLIARIRSRLRRAISHSNAVAVQAVDGRVTLRGPVLDAEASRLLNEVQKVAGVEAVEDRLIRISDHAEGFIDRTHAAELESDLYHATWKAPARIAAGVAGVALLGSAIRRRNAWSLISGFIGTSFLTRAISNVELLRLISLVTHPVVHLHRSIVVNAPIQEVFGFWRNFDHFAKFMSYVRDVRINEEGGFLWVMSGPGGMRVEWDAEVTRLVPNQLLMWRSVPGSVISHSGRVAFRDDHMTRTWVDVDLTYGIPGGPLGYGVIQLLGFDPRTRIDGDLLLMKHLIESAWQPDV